MRVIEGVSKSVNEKMNAVEGTILREDGQIQRQCEHGERHPVGDIHAGYVSSVELDRHRQHCCGCCTAWALAPMPVYVADARG